MSFNVLWLVTRPQAAAAWQVGDRSAGADRGPAWHA